MQGGVGARVIHPDGLLASRALIEQGSLSETAFHAVADRQPIRIYADMSRRKRGGQADDTIVEDDILAALDEVGLSPNTENTGWRGCNRGIDGRYVWWPKTQRKRIRCLHLGGFKAQAPLTQPIDNGNVRWELEFRGASRQTALAALKEAIRLLVQRV